MAESSVFLNRRRRPRNAYEVASVCKALEILCSFTAQQPRLSLSELSRRLEMPKSTTHNLLRTLEQYEFVHRNERDRLYRLGTRVYGLGALFSKGTEMVSHALPHLRRLAGQSGETVKLGLLSRGRVLVVAAVESVYQLHTRGDVGSSWPLHSTGLGKAILAGLSRQEVGAIVGEHGLERLTNRTLATTEALEGCLEEIRSRGYACDCEENEKGVCCLAVPLAVPAGEPPASVSVSAPSIRWTPESLRDWIPMLRDATTRIAAGVPISTSSVPSSSRAAS